MCEPLLNKVVNKIFMTAARKAGLIHSTAKSYADSKKAQPVAENDGRKKVVILGTGWGSYSLLRHVNKKKIDPIVVSPRNHFLFTPLLASTTVGTLEFRSVIEPIRNTGFRQPDHFHHAEAIALDFDNKVVHCQSMVNPENRYEINYDQLVIGVGAISNTFSVPGVEEHAHFLKEIVDARKIRNKILSNFERAIQPGTSREEKKRLLHTIIVGGGPTGVEFGAELYDFVCQDVSRLYKTESEFVKVTLIESNQILPAFDKKLQAYAEKKINERENFKMMKSTVSGVEKDAIKLKTGETIPCGLVVWSTGLAPREIVKGLKLPKSRLGQLLTDKHLAVKNTAHNEVFAIGDCASIEETPLPCSAQVAEQEGRYLAKYLSEGTPESFPDFKYQGRGMLAYLGANKALSDLPDFKLQGYTSWFLWRSAYVSKLGSWRLRMQVPIDWAKTFMFGRDISRF